MVQSRYKVFVFIAKYVILYLYHGFILGNILTVKSFNHLEELLEPFGWNPTLHDLKKLTSIHDRWSLRVVLRLRRWHYRSWNITYLLSHLGHIVVWLCDLFDLPVLLWCHRHHLLLLLLMSLERLLWHGFRALLKCRHQVLFYL